MRCPECGSEVVDSAAQCQACGAPLAPTGAGDGAQRRQGSLARYQEAVLFGCALAVIALLSSLYAIAAHWGGLVIGSRTAVEDNQLISIPRLLFVDKPDAFAGASLEHANPFTGMLAIVLIAVIVVSIVSAQRGRLPFIRRIPGLNALDDAVGRATEMGRPVLFSGGLAGIGIVSLQALAVGAHVARHAVRYGARMIVPVCDQTMMPITEQVIREVYTSEGRPDAYRPEDIRFLSDRQFAYAAGVTGILHRERVAANFLFGQFYAESLILAENGQAVGAIQVAGTPDLLQIPFFVVSCDYTIIGDEFYAASAYLTREPTLLGSLVGQDLGKAVMLVIILAGVIWNIFAGDHHFLYQMFGGQ